MRVATGRPHAGRSPRAVLSHIASICLIAMILAAAPVHGDQRDVASIDTLTRCAAVIFEGQVLEVRSEWNPEQTQIHTLVGLQVNECYKGALSTNRLDLRFLGGTVGEMTMAVLGQPVFSPGEKVFLFLAPNHETRDFPVVAGEQGKLVIEEDPVSDTEVLSSPWMRIAKSSVVQTIDEVMRPVLQGSR